jgi:hypothetical protein
MLGMLVPTMTEPMVRNEAFTGVWTHWLRLGHLGATLATAAGVKNAWLSWLPVLLLLVLALALAARATPALELHARQLGAGAAAAGCWALFAALGPHGLGIDQAAARVLAVVHQRHLGVHPYGDHPIAGLVLYCLGAACATLALTGLARAVGDRPWPRGMPLPLAADRPDTPRAVR